MLTELLAARCDHLTSTDVAAPALDATQRRLTASGAGDRVTLLKRSLDDPWPAEPFDLVVLSEVCYYLQRATLRTVLDREIPRLARGATLVAAHWRHPVADYPMTGDEVHELIGATPGLHHLGAYRDADVVIEVFDTGSADSVATRNRVPGA